jgi:hypothetical protein
MNAPAFIKPSVLSYNRFSLFKSGMSLYFLCWQLFNHVALSFQVANGSARAGKRFIGN